MDDRYILDYESLAKRIKETRKQKGLTQEQLADKTGLSWNFIAKIETDNATISLKTLVNIANVLDVSIDYMLLNDKSMKIEGEKTSTDIFIESMLKDFSDNDKELLINMINIFKVYKSKGE